MVWVKVCGVRTVEDAAACIRAGVDALGVNFHRPSPRYCEPARARELVEAVGTRALVIGVFVDATPEQIGATLSATGLGWAQLHGDEPPSALTPWLPRAYKAVRLSSDADGAAVAAYGGELLLVDAPGGDQPGGTGRLADWARAAVLARRRRIVLAGGLTAANVAAAIDAVRPYGVDVASGVEASPGVKDPEKVRAFVRAARAAAARGGFQPPAPRS